MQPSTQVGESQKIRRSRLRLCAVCGRRKHQQYMQTFTENVAKREEWMKLLYDNDAVLMEHLRQRLGSSGRKFICYDHFAADQFESTPQRALILKRNAVPLRYDISTFKPNRYLNSTNEPKPIRMCDDQAIHMDLLLIPPQISSMEFLLKNIEVYLQKRD
ncbi:unnamed protein product [Cylicocyclus nassatus]|uniref:THAP-type domain-containing protein n=1 Tax=Cylicocyclus nassatus TaxID=53992 RepID=A0AA36LZD9_CYLNA|nr:unnamed protein product [Cylicocyclus nassatus]